MRWRLAFRAPSISSAPRSEVAVASALEVFQSRVDPFKPHATGRSSKGTQQGTGCCQGAASDASAAGAAGEREAQMVLGRLELISQAERAMVQEVTARACSE